MLYIFIFMSKPPINIELNGKIIQKKPFDINLGLDVIREKINAKIKIENIPFLDLKGEKIEFEKEKEILLKDILDSKNIIRLKQDSKSEMNILLDNNNINFTNFSKEQNLKDLRQSLRNIIQENFIFLDDNNNPVDEEDEDSMICKDILRNNTIYLKTKKDFSKYKIISKREEDEFTIYKYSEKERQESQFLTFNYFYDNFNEEDYTTAYIVLFAGKTGAGKTTAINAFFNIIKGVKLEDNYRYILIEEPPKPKGQAESQTDGIHLYYLKDYNNKPIIIIDTQGYGDVRGTDKDIELNKSFDFVFSNIISHINTICFISNSTLARIDVETRYIYSCVTSLFADDVSENFIILATHANRDCMEKGPIFTQSIIKDADFLKIKERIKENTKWWYSFDSKLIIYKDKDEIDKLTKFSYEQLFNFYEEKVKKLMPKNIKKCAEVLKQRYQLRIQINNLQDYFLEIMKKQQDLKKNEVKLREISKEIKDTEEEIKNKEQSINNNIADKNSKDELIKEVNKKLEAEIKKYQNKKITKTVYSLEKTKYRNIYCNECHNNCHSPCDCAFTVFGRCVIYEFSGCFYHTN